MFPTLLAPPLGPDATVSMQKLSKTIQGLKRKPARDSGLPRKEKPWKYSERPMTMEKMEKMDK